MSITKGQIFTPIFITDFMVSLIGNKNKIKVLEPSVGEGIFIDSLLNYNNNIELDIVEKDKEIFEKVSKEYKNRKNIKFYNNDFLEFSKNKKSKYDIIIGNPPYIQNNEISNDTYGRILDLDLKIDNKEWDLYYYFIQQSIELLNEGGKLIFITPITFLTNTYSKSLRDFISKNGSLTNIYSLEEEKIFQNANIEVIIWTFEKGVTNIEQSLNIGIINRKLKFDNTEELKKNDFKISNIKNFTQNDFFWNIYNNENASQNDFKTPITNIFNISVGMVSGYDKGFYIEDKDILHFSENEKKYIKSIFKSKNCGNSKNNINKYIFIPKGEIEDEDELINNYPNIFKILEKHKKNLIKRYNKNKSKYWEWITVRNLEIYNNNELFLFIPTITRNSELGFTKYNGKILGGGDVIALTFKKEILDKDKEKYIKIITSLKYTNYIHSISLRKGGRKLFTHKFLTTLKI